MVDDDRTPTPGLKYPQISIKRRKGDEQFLDGEHKPISTVLKFWQWAYSGLSDNITRGVLAEFFVANAVGAARGVRDPWATYDIQDPRGFGIEVKSSAYLQTWAHDELSKITFSCRTTHAFDPATNELAIESRHHADVYVFALQTCQVQEDLDTLDVAQWEFYVVPTSWLDEPEGGRHSISLGTLKASERYGQPVSYRELKARIGEVAVTDAETVR